MDRTVRIPLHRGAGQRAEALVFALVIGVPSAALVALGGAVWFDEASHGGEMLRGAALWVLGFAGLWVAWGLVRAVAAGIAELRLERDALVVVEGAVLSAPWRIPREAVARVEVGAVKAAFRESGSRVQLSPFPEPPNLRITLEPEQAGVPARRATSVLTLLWPGRAPRRGDAVTTLWARAADPIEAHRALFAWLPEGGAVYAGASAKQTARP